MQGEAERAALLAAFPQINPISMQVDSAVPTP